MRKIIIMLILFVVTTGYVSAQVDGFVNKAVEEGETVVLKLASTEGNIEWQKSYDKETWETMSDVGDEFTFVADQTTYFRVVTSIGNCNPYISDSVSVTVYETVADIDGNIYKTIQVGDQIWMAENLRVTHYPDGKPIFQATEDSSWAYTDSMAYCWYNNDSLTYAETNGAYYNWAAAMYGSPSSILIPSEVQGVCPDGWHLPSDAEWQELDMVLGMSDVDAATESWNGTNEGAKLAGSSHLWNKGSLKLDSQFGTSGFNGLPTGDRTWDDGSIFYGMGVFGTWWSATSLNNSRDNIITRYIQFDRLQVRRGGTWKWNGNSVRCVKD